MNLGSDWAARIAARDRGAIARAISALENETADAGAVRAAISGRAGGARVLGVTGPAGVGKSTLVSALIGELLRRGASVAVVAVDPSSPVSGGAVLGDRLRMSEHQHDERVFIRSLAARGRLGGLARAARAAIGVLEAARFDTVIVETVGAGQSEVEIAEVAGTRLVLCPPDMGDEVQAIKAGILEIADIFVVNKADRPHAARAEEELRAMLAIRKRTDWTPPIVRTVAITGEGVAELLDQVERHRAWSGGRAAAAAPAVEYRVRRKSARIHDPRRDFALVEIESEVREDPLTGETARICHFAVPPRQVPDLAPLAEGTRAGCPFCPERVEAITPRYPDALVPGGRMARGEALLVPNLFPYDDVSAIVVMQRAHFAPMQALDAAVIADSLKLARDFIARAAATMAGREAWGIVTWNYMPPSGASQVHPHMQVVVTDTPGNALRRELEAETRFLERRGVPWPRALLDAERAAGERLVLEQGRVTWWTPFCPVGMLGDAQALLAERATLGECSDADLETFAQSLARLAAAYARLGQWSFNLTLFPDAEGERSGRHWLGARLLPRFYLHPQLHNSDVAYLQLLLGEKFGMVRPEAHAAALREALAAA
ncbi:MAG: methylmalonyl Co-A mutase-associated GTPase MeaB [Burkholderiales bacterium]|nr:methylmalonyl Co-A mutase-associated GTPase MeaB [Burkholderiales bacterium]